MAPAPSLSHLSNPLVTPDQLSDVGTSLDGIPVDLEVSIRFAGCQLTQAAGILLRLPQDVIAQAIVIYQRFWAGPEGGSLRQDHAKDVSAACVYMMAKLSAHPQTPRAILNVYAYLLSSASPISLPNEAVNSQPDPETYFLSDGTYYKQRTMLMQTEARILRVLGFSVHVALPYTLAINYLQALDVYSDTRSAAPLSQRVFSYLNTALISPQLLFLTHQPSALATAAIYLAARELKVKLPTEEWWEVFDVDREELGFLVVGMRSTEGFVRAERERWRKRIVPLSVDDVEAEIERRTMLETGV